MPKHGDFIKGAKVKIAHFNDQLQYCAKSFVKWINSLEDYFSWHKTEDPQHVAFVKMKLKGLARSWWQGIENKNVVFGGEQWIVKNCNLKMQILTLEHPLGRLHARENFNQSKEPNSLYLYLEDKITWNIKAVERDWRIAYNIEDCTMDFWPRRTSTEIEVEFSPNFEVWCRHWAHWIHAWSVRPREALEVMQQMK